MRSTVSRLGSFAIGIAILVGATMAVNWIPVVVEGDLLREYDSFDAVNAGLPSLPIYVPSYFPQDLRWPPSRILAQGRPFPAVLMEFEGRRSGRTALVISQSAGGRFPPDGTVRIAAVKEKTSYRLKGRDARLEVGACGDGGTCSRIAWTEGAYRIDVTGRSAPLELIRVAESMIR
ncbi:MAG: hypothetical protein ACM3NF_03535 [Gemmatimonadota bacterium]